MTTNRGLRRFLASPVLVALALYVAAGCAGPQRTPTASAANETARTFVYVGTGMGTIQIFGLDEGTGSLALKNKVSTGGALAALAAQPFERTLVALDERASAVMTFAIDVKGATLRPVARGSLGSGRPGRVGIDQSGKYVLVSNRGTASVAVLAVRPNGQLSPPELYPAGAGAYGFGFHPSNTLLFVANTKAGTISQMSFNAGTGALTAKAGGPVGLPAGSGPRQIVCHPGGRFIFVLNETSSSVSVHTFDDRMGTITPLAFQIVPTLSQEAGVVAPKNAQATDLAIAPNGHFVYVLNRGDDSLVTLSVDGETGALAFANRTPGGGSGATALAIDPTGKYLFVISGGSRHLSTFRIDDKTGIPTLTDSTRLDQPPLALIALAPRPS
jgi:6-phosphogluconolactonase